MADEEALIKDVSRSHFRNIVDSILVKHIGGDFIEKMRAAARDLAAEVNDRDALVATPDGPISLEDSGRIVEYYVSAWMPLVLDSLKEEDEKLAADKKAAASPADPAHT